MIRTTLLFTLLSLAAYAEETPRFMPENTGAEAHPIVAAVKMIGMAAKSNTDYTSYENEYNTQLANYNGATVPADIANYKVLVDQARADMTSANDQLTLFSAAAGGLWLINAIHAFLTGPDLADNASKLPIRLAYDPTLNQTQLRWEISL